MLLKEFYLNTNKLFIIVIIAKILILYLLKEKEYFSNNPIIDILILNTIKLSFYLSTI